MSRKATRRPRLVRRFMGLGILRLESNLSVTSVPVPFAIPIRFLSGRDLGGLEPCEVEIWRYAALVKPTIASYGLESNRTKGRNVFGTTRVGPTNRQAQLETAHPSASPSDSVIHDIRCHAVGEVTHAQRGGIARCAAPHKFDFNPAGNVDYLVAVVCVGD